MGRSSYSTRDCRHISGSLPSSPPLLSPPRRWVGWLTCGDSEAAATLLTIRTDSGSFCYSFYCDHGTQSVDGLGEGWCGGLTSKRRWEVGNTLRLPLPSGSLLDTRLHAPAMIRTGAPCRTLGDEGQGVLLCGLTGRDNYKVNVMDCDSWQ